MSSDFVLRGGIVVRPEHSPAPIDILVRDGRIAALLAPGEPVTEGVPVQAATGLHVFPGLMSSPASKAMRKPDAASTTASTSRPPTSCTSASSSSMSATTA